MTAGKALAFVEHQGVACEASRRGTIPCVADEIAGELVRGNWWSHARSRAIFAATRALRDSPDVLVCRLVDGRITFVHRRLWPALVRIADRIDPARLARLREVHSASGRHVIEQTPFPDWVPAEVLVLANRLEEHDALAQLKYVELT